MRKCGYCGCENLEQSDRCSGCGNTLSEISTAVKEPATEPKERAWPEWLGTSVRYAGVFITLPLLYLLSFGPVDHYCHKIVTRSSTPASYNSNGYNSAVTVVKVRYPLWVGLLYRPAMHLRVRSQIYGRYIALWGRTDEL
jgi:hypothetical protein